MNPILRKLLLSPRIVKNGLVLYLDGRDFTNSPPSALWMDRSGLGNNAVPTGFAYTTLSGSDGNGGVNQDGVDDKCVIPAINGVKCLELQWVTKVVGADSLIYFTGFGWYAGDMIAVRQLSTGTLNLLINTVGFTEFTIKSSFTLEEVNHLVINYKTGSAAVYLNGNYVGSIICPIPLTAYQGELGTGRDYGKNDVKICRAYTRNLTEAEILKNYHASR